MFDNKFELVIMDSGMYVKHTYEITTVILGKNLNPESFVARIINIYREFDNEINRQNVSSPCKKSCSDCCVSHFGVTQGEFFTVLYALGTKGNIIRYSNKAKEIIKKNCLPAEINDSFEISKSLILPPCIFVDETDKCCRIYEVRPTVCRAFGSVSELTDCAKIMNENTFEVKLAKRNSKIDELTEAASSINVLSARRYLRIEMPFKPMIYWLKDFDEKGNLESKRFENLYNSATQKSILDFVKTIG